MENNNVYKFLLLFALLVTAVAVTVGFSSFSTSLTVNNTAGTVVAGTNTLSTGVKFTSVTSGTISSDGKTWSGATINLNTTTSSVTVTGTISNTSGYKVYLYSFTGSGAVACTSSAAGSVSSSTLSTFCSKLTVTYKFGSTTLKTISGASSFGTVSLTGTTYNITSGSTATVAITVSYSGVTDFPVDDVAITVPAITTQFSTKNP